MNMTDIVGRLRAKRVRGRPGFYNPDELCQEAATEIERLRSNIGEQYRSVRWAKYKGPMDETERQRILAHPIFPIGDTILVWVNEGDILAIGENLDPPANTGGE